MKGQGVLSRWQWSSVTTRLALILLLSVVLRVGAAVALGNQVVELPGAADQLSYHTLATRVLDGHGFTFGEAWWPATQANEPTAHWSYIYTYFLVGIYSVVGVQPLAARLLQALLVGLLSPLFAFLLARQVNWRGGPRDQVAADRVALVAALITAVYIYFVYYSAALMTESFFITTVVAALYLAVRLVRQAQRQSIWAGAVFLGVAVTLAVLLRQLFLLFLPFLYLWILVVGYRAQLLRKLFAALSIATAILVLTILPITFSNYQRFERIVLLNTNAGYALYWANHPIHGTRFIPASEMGETYQELIPNELRSLDEAALDQALLRQGIEFMLEDPQRYALLSLSRIPAYFRFWPEPSSGMLSNLSRVGSFGLFLPFMLAGLLRPFLRLPRRSGQGLFQWPSETVWLLYLFVIVYTGIHVFTWALVRYRLPVDAVLVLFAAVPVEGLWHIVWRRLRPGRAATTSYSGVSGYD